MLMMMIKITSENERSLQKLLFKSWSTKNQLQGSSKSKVSGQMQIKSTFHENYQWTWELEIMFKNSLITHKEKTKEINLQWVSLRVIKTQLNFMPSFLDQKNPSSNY